MVLTIPLFLLMAAVNGAVLYFQEQAEVSRALTAQTLAAATVTAEFIAEMDDPQEELMKPRRQNALNAASASIDGLEGIYLVEITGEVTPLTQNTIPWSPPVEWLGRTAQPGAFQQDDTEIGFFAAIQPAGENRAVAARINAAPLLANRAQMTQIIAFIILGVSVFSALLSWFVAHRVSRELQWNRDQFASQTSASEATVQKELNIRETRDLSDAVRLMKASRDAAETRHQRSGERIAHNRTVNTASRELHNDAFPSAAFDLGAAHLAVRICGPISTGTFYAAAETGDDVCIFVGRCRSDQLGDGLANAAAARRFIENNIHSLGRERCAELAVEAFGIEALEYVTWPNATPQKAAPAFTCLAPDEVNMEAHQIALNGANLTPKQILDSIESVLNPVGIFTVIGPRQPQNGDACE